MTPGAPDGFSLEEIELVMGAPLPEGREQRIAYAKLALRRLFEHDKARANQAWLLGMAPDAMLDLWNEIAHGNTLDAQRRAAEQTSNVRPIGLRVVNTERKPQ